MLYTRYSSKLWQVLHRCNLQEKQTSAANQPRGMTRRDFTAMLFWDSTPVTSDIHHGLDVEQTIAKVMTH